MSFTFARTLFTLLMMGLGFWLALKKVHASKLEKFFLAFVFILFGSFALWFSHKEENNHKMEVQNLQKQIDELRLTGKLQPANELTPVDICDSIPPTAFRIFFGTSNETFVTQFPFNVLTVDDQRLLVLNKTPEGITMSLKVFSEDSNIVAEIIKNDFYINPNNYFRREFPDKSTLVVYDKKDNQVLYVHYLNSSAIKILGVLHFPGEEPITIEENSLILGNFHTPYKQNCFGNVGIVLHSGQVDIGR